MLIWNPQFNSHGSNDITRPKNLTVLEEKLDEFAKNLMKNEKMMNKLVSVGQKGARLSIVSQTPKTKYKRAQKKNFLFLSFLFKPGVFRSCKTPFADPTFSHVINSVLMFFTAPVRADFVDSEDDSVVV